jgi:hypothetical protein
LKPKVCFEIKKLDNTGTYFIKCVKQIDKLYCALVMGECKVTLSLLTNNPPNSPTMLILEGGFDML